MRVKGKRLGWDERLTPEQEMDMETYNLDGDHASDDLEGELVRASFPETDEHGRIDVVLIGGQEADPKTVEVIP